MRETLDSEKQGEIERVVWDRVERGLYGNLKTRVRGETPCL